MLLEVPTVQPLSPPGTATEAAELSSPTPGVVSAAAPGGVPGGVSGGVSGGGGGGGGGGGEVASQDAEQFLDKWRHRHRPGLKVFLRLPAYITHKERFFTSRSVKKKTTAAAAEATDSPPASPQASPQASPTAPPQASFVF